MKPIRALFFLVLVMGSLVAADYSAGQMVEVRWDDKWYPAIVIAKDGNSYRVQYMGAAADRGQEWVIASKVRPAADDDDDGEEMDEADEDEAETEEAPPAEAAKAEPTEPVAAPAVATGRWKVGDRVEGLSYGAWYPAGVIEAGDGKWKVHYDGYGSSSDEWLPAEKIRPLRKGSWKTGDRVEALSYGKWYKATITAAEEARWKVKYDDYTTEEWVLLDRVRAIGAKTDGGSDQAGRPVATYAFPARPAGAQAGIEGAFLRVQTSYFGSSLSITSQGWFFTKDGRFSKAPAGGFDLRAFAKAPAGKNDGTYWIAGGKITFAWADGTPPSVYDFENNGNELRWDGLGSTRVKGFPQGWRLDGEYEGGASVGGGALMSSTTIAFSRDGTFRRGSVSSVRMTSERTTVSGGAQSEAAGTYEFDGFTLTLRPAEGEEQKFTVFAFGDVDAAGRPAHIYRDGGMMRRQ